LLYYPNYFVIFFEIVADESIQQEAVGMFAKEYYDLTEVEQTAVRDRVMIRLKRVGSIPNKTVFLIGRDEKDPFYPRSENGGEKSREEKERGRVFFNSLLSPVSLTFNNVASA
jgi:hypothetical protein